MKKRSRDESISRYARHLAESETEYSAEDNHSLDYEEAVKGLSSDYVGKLLYYLDINNLRPSLANIKGWRRLNKI